MPQSPTEKALEIITKKIHQRSDKIRDVFLWMNGSRTGEITFSEFKESLETLGLNFTDEQLKEIMDSFDTRKKGTICYADFEKAVGNYDKSLEKDHEIYLTVQVNLRTLRDNIFALRKDIKEVFDDLDSNKDGIVTHQDLKIGLRRFQMQLGEDEVRLMCQPYDQNKKNGLTFAEFKTMLLDTRFD